MKDYPSEETLDRIRNFDPFHDEFGLLLDILRGAWWPDGDYGIRYENNILELHTWGWSGNESIIAALESNVHCFWMLFWCQSKRGGHYWFEIRDIREAGR
jgi:hypothetical protein